MVGGGIVLDDTPKPAARPPRWRLSQFPNTELSLRLWSARHAIDLGRLRCSTLLRRLDEGRYDLAADELPRWVMAGGRRLPGLVLRRELERALFLKPIAEPVLPAPPPAQVQSEPQGWLARFVAAFGRDLKGELAPAV